MSKRIIGIIVAVVVVFGASYLAGKRNNGDGSSSQTPVATTKSQTSGTTLDLSGQQLTSLPESVLNRTDVTVLNLSNNQLTTLPAGINRLTNLEVLNVENNRLQSFPPEISQLKHLREILANNNRMTSLQPELGNMTWLQLLDISGNDIPTSDSSQLKARLPNTQVKT